LKEILFAFDKLCKFSTTTTIRSSAQQEEKRKKKIQKPCGILWGGGG
jgi:hypothetical protein